MDKVILASVVSTSALTGYDIAARVQSAASYPLSFTTQAVIPAAANLKAVESTVRLQALLVRGTRYTLALSLPVTISAMILARPLIVGWVGPAYAYMSGPTQLFLAYQLVSSSATIANTMLIGMGRVRSVTLYASIAVAVNLVVSLLLVHSLGVSGVIIGTLVGFGITVPLYIRLVLRELSMELIDFVRQAIVPIAPWVALFAVVLVATAQVVSPVGLLAVAACCIPAGLIYVAAVVRFAMTAEERRGLLGFVTPVKKIP